MNVASPRIHPTAERWSSATVSATCPSRPHGVTILPPGRVCSTHTQGT
ncbi:hypothetical protein [Streptomyces sp. Inha503]